MKYLKNFNKHNNYTTFIVSSNFKNLKNDNISYCKQEKHIHYNPYIPIANLFDILYSDSNGNLSFTSEVLPVSEGKTPIALCITEQGFFGANEKARWMSLKYMNYITPETGSLIAQGMYWGNYGTDIPTINNIDATYNGGYNYGYFIDSGISSTPSIPTLFTENNKWNISVLGTVNEYTVTDIDGKNKTDKILTTAVGQSTWQTDISINNDYHSGYAPAACCCARYHTLGTQSGDWYLGSGGEMSMIVIKKIDINTKLAVINAIYPNDCINLLSNDPIWTSTENNGNNAYNIRVNDGLIYKDAKGNNYNVISLLQY